MSELSLQQRYEMQETRYRLNSSESARQMAMAEFPLKVNRLARDLLQLCIMRDRDGIELPASAERMVSRLEADILKAFRETFGRELFV